MNDAHDTMKLAIELTIAWLSNPNTRTEAEGVPIFLTAMCGALESLTASPSQQPIEVTTGHTPAVSARKSLANKDHIISMIDGKPYRTLRRHLSTHGMTPDEYRKRFGLKADYPMVAESYSEARRAMAKKIGLGRKRAVPAEVNQTPKRRGRKPAQAETAN